MNERNTGRWLAVPAGGDAIRLLPMDGSGPDFFVKASDYDALRAERDQFKAMWERDSTALGKALAQRDTARADAEDKRARVAEAVRMIEGYKRAGLLTNPATAEQATDFISRATGNKPAQQKGDV